MLVAMMIYGRMVVVGGLRLLVVFGFVLLRVVMAGIREVELPGWLGDFGWQWLDQSKQRRRRSAIAGGADS